MLTKEVFLVLVRLGVGTETSRQPSNHIYPEEVDWSAIETLAAEQGLSAVVVDGVERLPLEVRPPKPVLLQWIGEVLQGYEYRYELYRRAIAEMAAFYTQYGFKMMVLKGFACSLDWPKPEHRPCGDIDIWQFGQQKEADAVLAKEKGIKVDKSHHHHTVFGWRDFMVENHYDFVNTMDMKLSKKIEKLFKGLGKDDSHFVELYGEKIYLPSPNLHALFLSRHMVAHFVSTSVSIRQILDWGLFIKAHSAEIDWKWLMGVIEEYGMTVFFNCINAICIEDLGIASDVFPNVQFDSAMKDRILNDVLYPKFTKEEPDGFVRKYVYKVKRWQGNAWKQRMCYPESRLSIFVRGLWAHIVTPKA